MRMIMSKTPGDAYNAGVKLLANLKALTETYKDLAIPGGIVLPEAKEGKVTPGDVILIQNNLLAELSSLKAKVGVKTPTKDFPPQAAKTPSNVVGAIEGAQDYLNAISGIMFENS